MRPADAGSSCAHFRSLRHQPSTGRTTIERAPASDQVAAIGDIVDVGDGSGEVTLTANGELAVGAFLITAGDGIRPVVLPSRRATLERLPVFGDDFESGGTRAWSATVP